MPSSPTMRDYQIAWLQREDARRAAAIERKAHVRGYRAGGRDIASQLEEAEATGDNLSAGLYHGSRMVGYMLSFRESDRRNICEYIDAIPPAGIDLTGPGIYIADVALLSPHRRALPFFLARLANVMEARQDLRNLPIDAFSRAEHLRYWTRHTRALGALGFRAAGVHEFHCRSEDETLFWLTLQHAPVPATPRADDLERELKGARTVELDGAEVQIGHIDTLRGWTQLQPAWDALVRATPGATVFQSYQYQRLWWRLLGLGRQLFIVTVLKHGEPIAIAPLQVYPEPALGTTYRTAAFIVDAWESDRPRVLAADASDRLVQIVLDYIFDHRDRWDSVYLHEQRSEDPFARAWRDRLQTRGFLLSSYKGTGCPLIEIEGSWQDYLRSRTRSLRKSVRRKLSAIRNQGDVRMVHAQTPEAITAAFEQYLAIEAASWKHDTRAAVTKSNAHCAFIRELLDRFGRCGRARVSLLYLNDQPIAGTFGLLWNGTYYSLNVVHDERYSRHSPGFVLTCLELEHVFASGDIRRYDLLSGFPQNKVCWATDVIETGSLYAHTPDLRGRLFHVYHFRMKPRIKRTLERLGSLDAVITLIARVRGRHRKEYLDV